MLYFQRLSNLIPRKKKAKTTSQLKKEADRVFSIYVRLKYSDHNGYCECFTCYAKKHYKEIQNGHFVSRSHLSLRYDERNCRPQCAGCNIWGRGRPAEFGIRLEQENPGIVVTLLQESQRIVKDFPYQKIIDYYGKTQNGKNGIM